ncbi:hypothetical protein GCM10027059_50540 [Myceligenerans halotolerans]
MHNLYTLTSLTGRDADANRSVVVFGLEARQRPLVVALVAALPGLVAMLVLLPVLGEFAVLMLPLVVVAALVLVEMRVRTGLRHRTYQALLDRGRSDAGKFFLCGRRIDPDQWELSLLRTACTPNLEPVPARRTGRGQR